jgi:hypothetical protein
MFGGAMGDDRSRNEIHRYGNQDGCSGDGDEHGSTSPLMSMPISGIRNRDHRLSSGRCSRNKNNRGIVYVVVWK